MQINENKIRKNLNQRQENDIRYFGSYRLNGVQNGRKVDKSLCKTHAGVQLRHRGHFRLFMDLLSVDFCDSLYYEYEHLDKPLHQNRKICGKSL